MSDANVALNRFGLGARADEPGLTDAKAWLLAQFDRYDGAPAALGGLPTSKAVAADFAAYQQEQRRMRQGNAAVTPPPAVTGDPVMAAPATNPATNLATMARQAARQVAQGRYTAAVAARASVALTTPAPFVERMVHFWANHFAVSADKLELIGLAGTLEFEAIRPHVLGRFADLLGAVERHPAMLLYLDQARSVGPNSPIGSRVAARGVRTLGLNENLAREIIELHTLGVRTGYTQADVTEFARAMTGWTVAGLGQGAAARAAGAEPGSFLFAAALHEPGERTILRRPYPAAGEAQAQAVLTDLAVHPATARHLATKLTRHIAGDMPPPAMVARVEAAFLRSGGDLPTVYRALIASPEAWTPTSAKFRTPWEWTIAAMRALGTRTVQPAAVTGLLGQLGQPVWRPGAPAGYDDIAASWAGPDAVLRRVEAAERLAGRAGQVDARALAASLFPGAVTPETAQAIERAESPGQALALLLVSPEMMRR